MSVGAVDVTYRGVFQKNLAGVITKELVKAARREDKVGGTVQRYGDSPERNGIPAKQFAVIADDMDSLRVEMTKYEPENIVVVCVMDDTMTKGIESWAWYGVRPINLNLAPGGTLLVISAPVPGGAAALDSPPAATRGAWRSCPASPRSAGCGCTTTTAPTTARWARCRGSPAA